MLKFTFQNLLLEGKIKAYYKYIFINKNNRNRRLRLHIKLGENYNENNSLSNAEQFVLSIVKSKDEIRPYEIKNYALKHLDNDISKFRSKYVYPDVRNLYLFRFLSLHILNTKGREAKHNYDTLIELINSETDDLIKTPNILNVHLKELGNGIIFLEDETLKKIKVEIFDLDEIAHVFESIIYDGYGGNGGYYYSGGGGFSGGGFSGGSFGGGSFGGGSFGGGGSGGSW